MTQRRVGGSLLVAGSAGFGLKVLSSLLGSRSTLGSTLQAVPYPIYVGSMVLLALGAAIVAIDGPPLRAARLARAGLALSMIGLLGLAYLEANPLPVVGDVLENPLIVWPLYLCYPLGQIVLGLALVREPGLGRVVGALLIGALPAMVMLLETQGPAAAPGAGTSSARVAGTIGLLACAICIVLGWAGLGFLVFCRAAGRESPSQSST